MALCVKVALLAAVLGCRGSSSQMTADSELALLLAKPDTRQKAIAEILVAKGTKIPLMLSWTRTPPPGLSPLDQYQLKMGLAEAFGQLRAKEGIPFLIQNLTLNRFPATNVWARPPEVILDRLPAVAALIEIGPESSIALMDAWQRMTVEDRPAAIFVLSRVPGVPKARDYLHTALGEASLQRTLAEEGLKLLEGHP